MFYFVHRFLEISRFARETSLIYRVSLRSNNNAKTDDSIELGQIRTIRVKK